MKDYSSIVVSSKVRLMRNLNGFRFPSFYEGDEGIKVLNKIADVILKFDEEFKLYKIKSLPELDANIMHEKRLISNALLDGKNFSAVLLSPSEDVSIMINETDHIVETCEMSGLNLINAYDRINAVDNQILSKLDIAFDDSIGFLTSNISSVGTGLKASITLFIPALSIMGRIKEISSYVSNQGYEFSSIIDNEIESMAYTFVVSNIQTIGKKETDYVVKVSEIALKICEMEIRARNELLQAQNSDKVKDKVFRAWGILTNCYQISHTEAGELLGDLKMGVALDIVRFKEVNFIEHLLIDVLPYSLTKISGSKITMAELDKFRATFLANILKAKRIK